MIVGVLKALFTVDASKFVSGMQKVKSSTKQAENGIKKASTSLVGFKTKLAATATVAIGAATKLTRMAREVESIDKKLLFATGSAEEAGDAFSYLQEEADRLGVSLKVLAKEYGNFVAASKSANMTTEDVRAVFSSVAEAAAVLRMDTQATKLSFLALSQMMSKGVVMSEELKRQLGDHLPGAAQIMAKALGVNVREMNKMMQTTGLMSSEVLPMFAKTLHQDMVPGLKELDSSLSAAVGRMQSAWFEFSRLFLGEQSLITQSLKAMTNAASSLLKTLTEGVDPGTILGGTSKELDRLSDLYNDKKEEIVSIEKEVQEALYEVDYDGMQKRIKLQEAAFMKEKALFEERHADIIGFFENTLDSTLHLMQTWATGGKVSFKDFTDSILKDMMRIVHQALVAKPLMDALRSFLDVSEQAPLGRKSTGGFFSTLFSFLGSGFKSPTKAFADGGVISEPVAGVGLSSGNRYTFGEEGREAVVPLKGSKVSEPTSNNVVNVNINALDSRSVAELMRSNPAAVTAPIVDALQGGDRGLMTAMRGAM